MTTPDLNAALHVAEDCARRAGALLREFSRRSFRVDRKGPIDVVTEADRASEALVIEHLHTAFPDHHIIGEESGGVGAARSEASYLWHIDPLDGTTNFSRGLPHYAVSIGLSDAQGVPLLGVVYDPVRDELFKAIRGGGATLNGTPVQVSRTPKLADALLTSGFPYDSWTNPDNNAEEWSVFLTRAQGTRCLGAAALDLSYVACGRLDGYWERDLKTWDFVAGAVLVVEAGGRLSDYRGRTTNLYSGREVVASNGLIHEDMLTIIVLGRDAPRPKA